MSSLQLKKMVGKIFLFLIATVKITDNKHTVLLQPHQHLTKLCLIRFKPAGGNICFAF